jgi:hypothetical protein
MSAPLDGTCPQETLARAQAVVLGRDRHDAARLRLDIAMGMQQGR